MKMKSILVPLAVLVFAGAFAATTKVGELVKNAAKFDSKEVTTSGIVAKFQARTSKVGNKYYVFQLQEGKDVVNVYGRGELKKNPANGQHVQVMGKFEAEHKMRDFSIKNQVTVEAEKDIKILPK